ncbi:MAG: PAS domain S-box protein [Promethearchaeota archaeon]
MDSKNSFDLIEKYKLIVNNAKDLIAIYNESFECEYINENVLKDILGYSFEDIKGEKSIKTIHPDDFQIAKKIYYKTFKTGVGYGESRIKCKDGNYKWLESRGKIFKVNGKKKLILISRDVTERKQIEQKLKESEKKFKLITDNVNDLIAILNKDFKHEFINKKAYFNVLGYAEEEVIGKRVRDFIHPDDIKEITKATKTGLLKGEMLEEYRIKHKNGHYIWVETKGSFLKEKGIISGVIFISRDITDKKEAEQKVVESENKYRTLFESSTDGIYSSDMEGNFIEFNKAFLKMLGYTGKELLNKNNRQITPSKWYDIEDEITFTQLSENESKIYEKEFIRKDGSTIPVSVRFWILQDEQDDPYRIWAIVRDITELKQIENELKEINLLKSEFLRRASHELKTPLVSIKGFSELILSKYSEDLNQNIISYLEEINKGCERLQSIINNLIQTSKLESSDFKPKLEKEDLSFLINYCVEELHPLVAKREHSINLEIQDSIITNFEKEEIHDVISNLLINAIKYTPTKGWIDIRSKISENYVIISIKDNGIGFTEKEKSKIFQQFGKIERYGQGLDLGIDGSGLGLYISKKIIEAHGGKIWMESEGKNKGSTFYFSLPLIKD